MINLIKLTDSQDKALGLQYATELPIGVGYCLCFLIQCLRRSTCVT